MFKGPSPGEPYPPKMQVLTHFLVQVSAFLDLGRWILYLFLQSFCSGVHTLDNVCGIFESVSSGCFGAATSIAPADNTNAAVAAAETTAPAIRWRTRAVMRVEARGKGTLLGNS
ncbi:UNVERIFIED_CONTAM: hypothetical protein Sangu_1585000 [Sesamum angustifolium]|uniref:Uncharacterized protein n=1 Tax=Sesamum angustifolium TaxID=2727405 RepID=A0AAW2MU76_9LAMI